MDQKSKVTRGLLHCHQNLVHCLEKDANLDETQALCLLKSRNSFDANAAETNVLKPRKLTPPR